MSPQRARELLLEIPDEARVVDIGGGAAPFPRADHVIDALPFEAAGRGSDGSGRSPREAFARAGPENWTQLDVCRRSPWPFPDKSFDFAVCSHLLEDVRDPIWVCSEMVRIAKAGYIETPSRVEEQSRGVEHPRYAGYAHHRWLVSVHEGGLRFRHKPHALHALNDAIVADLAPDKRINPIHAVAALDWVDRFEFGEVLEFDERATNDELCAFADGARRLPDLTVRVPMPFMRRLKRRLFYRRLAGGRR